MSEMLTLDPSPLSSHQPSADVAHIYFYQQEFLTSKPDFLIYTNYATATHQGDYFFLTVVAFVLYLY